MEGSAIVVGSHVRMQAAGDRLRSLLKGATDCGLNRIPISENFVIPETQNPKSLRLEPLGPSVIVFLVLGMLPAVDFNYQTALETHEVHDVETDRDLPVELKVGKTPIPEPFPNDVFGLRLGLPKFTGSIVRHLHHFKETPESLTTVNLRVWFPSITHGVSATRRRSERTVGS